MTWELTPDIMLGTPENIIRNLQRENYFVMEMSKLKSMTVKQLGSLLA
jgi:hypothetical protein